MVDLRAADAPTSAELADRADALAEPVIALYKRRGVDPLLNLLHDERLEVGFEVILPGVGETIDGGLRDEALLRDFE